METYNMDQQKMESELAIFWEDIASNLPKSIEREALGDEKLYRAFAKSYPRIREYFITKFKKEKEETERKTREKIIWEIDERLDRGDSWSHEIRGDLLSTPSPSNE